MSGLVLVMLYVRDLARVETFYREMLGLRRIEQFSSATFAFLKPQAGTPLALQPVSEMPAGMTAQPGATQLGFDVADVDAAYANWKAKGADVVSGIVDMGAGRMFLARDPDGNLLSVSQLHDGVRAYRQQLGL